jgi:hypothetical protein
VELIYYTYLRHTAYFEGAWESDPATAVGLYKLTNSLKAPNFKPCTWFQAFAFKFNLYRYTAVVVRRNARRRLSVSEGDGGDGGSVGELDGGGSKVGSGGGGSGGGGRGGGYGALDGSNGSKDGGDDEEEEMHMVLPRCPTFFKTWNDYESVAIMTWIGKDFSWWGCNFTPLSRSFTPCSYCTS